MKKFIGFRRAHPCASFSLEVTEEGNYRSVAMRRTQENKRHAESGQDRAHCEILQILLINSISGSRATQCHLLLGKPGTSEKEHARKALVQTHET